MKTTSRIETEGVVAREGRTRREKALPRKREYRHTPEVHSPEALAPVQNEAWMVLEQTLLTPFLFQESTYHKNPVCLHFSLMAKVMVFKFPLC